MVDLTTTNVLLGILAAVAVVQLTGLVIGGVMGWRAYQRALDRVEELEQRVQTAIAPLATRANGVMDRVERIAERVDNGTEKLDYALAVTGHGAQVAMNAVNGNVQRTAAIAAALASGGRAAIRAWRARGEATRDVKQHRTEESHVPI